MAKLRLLLGKIPARVLTSGEMASAKKRAAKMIDRPKLALYKRYPAAIKPIITSQKRMKVLVSIWTLVVVLISTLYHLEFLKV